DERELHLAARAPAITADVRDELIEAGIRERVVLHLADRTPARHAQTDRGAENPGLCKRCVEATIRAEAFAQAGRRAKDATRAADVLAHDHHGVVALELDVKRVVDRLDDRELSQGCAAVPRDPTRTTRADRRTRARTRAPDRAPARPPRRRYPRAAHRPLRNESTPRARRAGFRRAVGRPRSARDTRASSPPR